MNFFRKIANSIYGEEFYLGVKNESKWSVFGYYFGLSAILSVAIAFVLGAQTSIFFSGENLKKFISFYPSELEVKIKSGSISTNVPEPYSIRETSRTSSGQKYTNLLVIDTKSDFSISKFKDYDTMFLLGKNYLVASRSGGKFEVNDLSKVPDFTLNQQKLYSWISVVDDNHLWISIALFFLFFIGIMLSFSMWLVSVLILALLVKWLLKSKGLIYTYKESFKVSIYATTLPLLIYTLFMIVGIDFSFPFFYTIISLIVVFVNFKNVSVPKDVPTLKV